MTLLAENTYQKKIDNTHCILADDVSKSCQRICEEYDVEWYMFSLSVLESYHSPRQAIYTNYPEFWVEKYKKGDYRRVDPSVKYSVSHSSPITWDNLMSLDGYNEPEHIAFMKEAADYGLKYGFSIPIGSYGILAVLNFADSRESARERFNSILPHAYLSMSNILDLAILQPEYQSRGDDWGLSLREKDCLFWGAEGKTAWEISQILGLSERTVVFHFTNATEKLNAKNRQHAIAKAIRFGVIKPMF